MVRLNQIYEPQERSDRKLHTSNFKCLNISDLYSIETNRAVLRPDNFF